MTLCIIINPLGGEKMTNTKDQVMSVDGLINLFIEDNINGKKGIVDSDS